MLIHRIIAKQLLDAAQKYPVITLTGPRQSGKTTLCRHVFKDYVYISLEDPDNAQMAKEDPRGFLGMHTGNVILDEVQRVPHLFSYIQTLADVEDRPGRFVLTGSHNFLLMEKITQSLAGRCAIFHLLPFSRAELMLETPLDIETLGRNVKITDHPVQMDLYDMMFRGFYPRIYDKDLNPQEWLHDYLHSYIERDVRLISNIGSVDEFERFMGLCAGRSGQILNISSLAADCGISQITAKKWISILESSFIIKLLRPHFQNFNKRLIKSPKLYFNDTGLLCYLLRIRSVEELKTHGMRGMIFETWVVGEFIKNYFNRRLEPDIYYWRDSNANEVDLIVSLGNKLVPVAIKCGQTFNSDMLKELVFWRNLTNCPDHPGVLIYGGAKPLRFKGLEILPWYMC